MKKSKLLIICALCFLCLLPVACQNDTPPVDPQHTPGQTEGETEPVTLSPEEIKHAENLAYLEDVTYLDYELTGESAPYFVDRWFEKEIDGVSHHVTLTGGSSLYFLINGAESFDVSFTVITTLEEPYYAYSIDGGDPVRKHISDATVTLPDSGRHTVRIIADGMTEAEGKWTEEKGFALKSITPASGGEIFGIKPKNKVIFFYGDSITEGVRALNMNANSDGNSATNAFPWFCSRELGCVPYTIGYGASGILMPGSFHNMLFAIDYLSENRKVDDGCIPDLIVINHGVNDASQPTNAFRNYLRNTLSRLQDKYPDVPIVYVIPFIQSQADNIVFVMEEYENVYVIQTEGWEITFTDNGYHPNVAGATLAGQKIADALRDLLGEDFFS